MDMSKRKQVANMLICIPNSPPPQNICIPAANELSCLSVSKQICQDFTSPTHHSESK